MTPGRRSHWPLRCRSSTVFHVKVHPVQWIFKVPNNGDKTSNQIGGYCFVPEMIRSHYRVEGNPRSGAASLPQPKGFDLALKSVAEECWAEFAIGYKCSGASLGTARMESGFLREFSYDSSLGFSSIGCFPQLLYSIWSINVSPGWQ
jgi:hypothetical protein